MSALSPAPVDPPPSMPFTSATFAAIIFPYDELRPRIVHVECLAFIEPASSLMNWTPRVREHMLVGPHDSIGSLTIETGISEGAPLRYPLQVFFTRNGPGSHLVNQSIYSLSKGQASQTGGHIIILKYSGTRRQGYIDASFNDLPTLVSHFIQSSLKGRP
ncbi:MYND Zn-finger protein [Ceratobasidium sp. AG-Ba]|nr:MYND Zn-finger protein [Ceratobasidium sp. AG-Ba]